MGAKPVVGNQQSAVTYEDLEEGLTSEQTPGGNPREYLESVAARPYDPCMANLDLGNDCQKPEAVKNRIDEKIRSVTQQLDDAVKLKLEGMSDEARAKTRGAARELQQLGITTANAVDFYQTFPTELEKIKILLSRIRGVAFARPFIAVQEPGNPSRNLAFKENVALEPNPSRSVNCSYISMADFSASLFVHLVDELRSWANGNYLCWVVKAPDTIAQATPKVEETPEPAGQKKEEDVPPPEKLPEPVAPPPQVKPSPPKKKPLRSGTAVSAPSSPPRQHSPRHVAKRVIQPPPEPLNCKEVFPEHISELWHQAKPVSKSDVANASMVRCGYNLIHKKYTPLSALSFDIRGDRLFLSVDGKVHTYNLTEDNGRLVGDYDNPSQWIVPPHMGGPRGNWGPLEIRELKNKRLLIYFRVPSDDGKDYFYAVAMAEKGELI